MSSTQISCPHCRSTLTFAQNAPAGTVLTCLICNRPIRVGAATAAAVAKASPAPRPVASSSKGGAAMPASQPQLRTSVPVASIAPPAPPAGSRHGLGLAVLAALLLLLGGGAGAFLWHLWSNGSNGLPTDNPVAAVPKGDEPSAALPPTKVVEPAPIGTPKPVESPAASPKQNGEPPATPVDIADIMKPPADPPPVVVTEPKVKQEVDPKLPVPPTVPVVVPALPADPRVEAAIAKGVRYLRERQLANGSWDSTYFADTQETGYAALGGLALLECGAKADDPAVQRAARLVRTNGAKAGNVYQSSLAILFLDRLGDPKDRPLIQAAALRLLAGQNKAGGWSYLCGPVPPQALQQTNQALQTRWPWSVAHPRPADIDAKARADDAKKEPKKEAGKLPVINLEQLPAAALEWNPHAGFDYSGGDNSNTQFALMALWVARRHGIAVECPLLLTYQRFRTTQNEDGGWAYSGGEPRSKSTMTCAGLLGLAMGHGAVPGGKGNKDRLEDRSIRDGLRNLGRVIAGGGGDVTDKAAHQNLYFLWSVERVAVLYDLKTIGGTDWYAWGSEILLSNQQAAGNWTRGGYQGATDPIDTCLALLFLKRSNLVPDLTRNLRLYMVIRDPGAK